MRSKRWTSLVAVLGLMLAACGSSSTSSSSASGSGTGTGSQSAGTTEAKAIVAKALQFPTSIGITQKLSKAIPKGKNIDYMDCGSPSCKDLGDALQQATDLLGWNLKRINVGAAPETIKAAWDQAVQSNPDGVVTIAYPRVLFNDELATLASKNVPVVDCCITDAAGTGLTLVSTASDTAKSVGALMADWTVADTNGQANVGFVTIPGFPILAAYLDGYKAELTRLCSSCSLQTLEVPITDIGTNLPTKAVNFVRANSSMNYLAMGFDDMVTGVPGALADAALADKVKIVSEDPSPTSQTYISNGQVEVATVAFPHFEEMWKMADALARSFVGDPVDPDNAALPRQILTKSNIKDPAQYQPIVPDYQAQFKQLWGIS